jgi:hypothetical protein
MQSLMEAVQDELAKTITAGDVWRDKIQLAIDQSGHRRHRPAVSCSALNDGAQSVQGAGSIP